jgi:hypothetical protein
MQTTPTPFIQDLNWYTPIRDIKVVTPSDAADLPNGVCRAVIFNGTGNITFITPGDTTVTLAITSSWFGVQYIMAKKVLATGTTMPANTIYACY